MKLVIATLTSVLALTAAARAADVIIEEAPAPLVVDVFSWTGGYIGIFGGLTAGDREYTLEVQGDDVLDASVTSSGGFFGAQVGYDHQFANNFVIGAVADIAWSGDEAEITVDVGGFDGELSSELQYLGTVRGRLGYAVDRALFYAHGGFAYGEMEYTAELGPFEAEIDDVSKSGYVVGAGLEYAFTDNISFQTEYSFVDLGEDEVGDLDFGRIDIDLNEEVQFHMLKAAVNYRF